MRASECCSYVGQSVCGDAATAQMFSKISLVFENKEKMREAKVARAVEMDLWEPEDSLFSCGVKNIKI